MELVIITGMASGGTSAAAGCLAKNSYFCPYKPQPGCEPTYEAQAGWDAIAWRNGRDPDFRGLWCETHPLEESHIQRAQEIFEQYKNEARTCGYRRAVIKLPGYPIFRPELLEGQKVILVSRNPQENVKSARKKWTKIPIDVLSEAIFHGQMKIQQLHMKYGWPVWKFSKQASVKELEAIVGHSLPVEHFNPLRIRS